MEVKWSNGKTTLDFDKAQVNISNRVQVRFTQESPDGAVQLAGTEAAGDGKGSFRMRRAKFKVDGWFYTRFLTYEIQLNWPAATGSNIGASSMSAGSSACRMSGVRALPRERASSR
jgi:hypothetical protein